MMKKSLNTLLVMVGLGVTLVGCTHMGTSTAGDTDSPAAHWEVPQQALARHNPVPNDALSQNRGQQLYAQNCTFCHGADATGNGLAAFFLSPRPANLTAIASVQSDGSIAWKIAQGRGMMPAWREKLSEAAIWDLVNYIHSLSEEA